jgi:hypothetical protein
MRAFIGSTMQGLPGLVRGTRLRSHGGEVAAEALIPGDSLLTLNGRARNVARVVRRRIDLSRHPRPETAWPLRIHRGAIANGVPDRDLLVSPGQILFLAGAKLMAHDLVNGATITTEPVSSIEYFHVALSGRDVLVASGVPIETCPEPALHPAFAGGAALLLHPEFAPTPDRSLDPLTQSVRRHLLDRAQALGHGITRDPCLHLLVDNNPVHPAAIEGARHVFDMPPRPGLRELHIVSRAGIPAELDAASTDHRRHGVRLGPVILAGEGWREEIGPADPRLQEGFHEASGLGGRWTDGHARLPVQHPYLGTVEFLVLGVHPAWTADAIPAAPADRRA